MNKYTVAELASRLQWYASESEIRVSLLHESRARMIRGIAKQDATTVVLMVEDGPIVPKPTPPVCKPTLTDALCEARVMLDHINRTGSLDDLKYDECVEVYQLVETLRQLGAFVAGD